jgi:maltooligosyltrehalose trehalohydrolase
MLFQGEEWGALTPFQYFTDHPEPELAKAVREGRRREFAAFGWKPKEVPDPQARETFERSKLDWTELEDQPHAALLDWHRRLIQLRFHEPALIDSRLELVNARFDEAARWLALERGPITVACNFSSQPRCVPLRDGKHIILLASDEEIKLGDGGLNMPPDTVAILKHESQSSTN